MNLDKLEIRMEERPGVGLFAHIATPGDSTKLLCGHTPKRRTFGGTLGGFHKPVLCRACWLAFLALSRGGKMLLGVTEIQGGL